ncbi:MAG: glycosyltransferase family 2 protein [Verrucomicrobia bacterium]|nr:glycosyltransferase family 2 protein [Verrucomicrobiota bacterium]
MVTRVEDPLITIIIPTYRRPELLKRAILSAVNQTYPLFQVQVYDNASGDETQDVVREFSRKDPRVKYHCHPKNIGMIANYEYALKNVETRFFSFLSDDDLIFPWFLEVALQGMQTAPDAGFSACSTIIMSEDKKIIRVPIDLWTREGTFSPGLGVMEMISKYPIPTCVLFDRKVIQDVSIDAENPLTWDCDFLLHVAARYPIIVTKRPCGIFLHHCLSYSKVQDFKNWEHAHSRLIKRICLIDQLSDEIKEAAIQLIHNDLKVTNRAFVLQSLFDKKFTQAREYASSFRKNYGLCSTGFILTALSILCSWFPPTFYFLYLLRKIKRAGNRNNLSSYKKYMDLF